VLARAVYSLHDLLESGGDVVSTDMPLAAARAFAGGAAEGATVGELRMSLSGFDLVKALLAKSG
jgi:hypothetical protein